VDHSKIGEVAAWHISLILVNISRGGRTETALPFLVCFYTYSLSFWAGIGWGLAGIILSQHNYWNPGGSILLNTI